MRIAPLMVALSAAVLLAGGSTVQAETAPLRLAAIGESIAAGEAHSCATRTDGTPVCWGDDSSGQATVPSGTGTVTQLSAGGIHTCAVKTDGTPVCWGDDGSGQATVPAG